MDSTDIAILGAGPNGLATAAHLNAAGVENLIFGYPFAAWRDHMPRGMLLKSEPYGSDVAAPLPGYRVRDYCLATGTDYADRGLPVSVESFVGYGDWFTRSLVPDVLRTHVTAVRRTGGQFCMTTAAGEQVTARHVRDATGLLPFAYLPEVLRTLPGDLASHTTDDADLSAFHGRRVGVAGAGQSAHEDCRLAPRDRRRGGTDSAGQGPGLQRTLPRTVAVPRRPAMAGHSPLRGLGLLGLLQPTRRFPGPVGERQVGPRIPVNLRAGAPWLRDRVEGRFVAITGTSITGAVPSGTRVRLVLDGSRRSEVHYDHVIAGTGFRLDLDRLDYLSEDLRSGVATAGGAPVLSRSFESTVPGLFFVGYVAAGSLGPRCGSFPEPGSPRGAWPVTSAPPAGAEVRPGIAHVTGPDPVLWSKSEMRMSCRRRDASYASARRGKRG